MRTVVLNLVTLTLLTSFAQAATMRAGCYLQNGDAGQVEGVNLDRRYEIASVSKVMTSYWALKTLGYSGRFTTTFYLKKINSETYDVHIAGSRDPFTGLEMLQYAVGQLNLLGVRSIRSLTFDERFKFISAVRSGKTAEGHYDLESPNESRVSSELRAALRNINGGYAVLVTRARSIRQLNLPAHLSLHVGDVRFEERGRFDPKDYDSAYLYQSAPLNVLLKEMNRNSNNHAANQVFESLGGAATFSRFIKSDMNLDENEIRFVNGSGDRYDSSSGPLYNEATCRTLVSIVRSLQSELKKSNHALQNVMAVAGDDDAGEKSTVSKFYDNAVTHQALIAKTGTVSPSVTLAGMISTDEGEIFFGYIYGTRGTAGDWRDGRNKIRSQVVRLMNNHGGSEMLHYDAIRFLPFDSDSALARLENRSAEAGGP